MVVKIRAKGEHLLELISQPGVEGQELLNESNVENIEKFPHAWSLVDVYGRVWAIVGILEIEPNKWEAFMFVDPKAGPHMVSITKVVKDYFSSFDAEQVEANVKCDFDSGHRYMRMLGFKEKAPGEMHDPREGREYVPYILKLRE